MDIQLAHSINSSSKVPSHFIQFCVHMRSISRFWLFDNSFGISFLIIARNSISECGEQMCATYGMVNWMAFIHLLWLGTKSTETGKRLLILDRIK
uniref:Uncharacterized protein n=1 Tax=Romanomermis culicivorax TaxID=13658 RepID=A0A915JHF9_ROMCU